MAAIAPSKDADGLHPTHLGNLLGGKPSTVPCTPAGCPEILDHYGIAIEGAGGGVGGRTAPGGKPPAPLPPGRHPTGAVGHPRLAQYG